jgi:hypothetical protein
MRCLGPASFCAGGGAVPFSGGRTECLDATASGNALVRDIQVVGHDVDSVEAMTALARGSPAPATCLTINAAVVTGGVLVTIVNFFNPDRLVLDGVLADSSVFVAGVRSTLLADYLPMATEQLSVDVTSDRRNSGRTRGSAHTPPPCFPAMGRVGFLRYSPERRRHSADRHPISNVPPLRSSTPRPSLTSKTRHPELAYPSKPATGQGSVIRPHRVRRYRKICFYASDESLLASRSCLER